MTPHGPSQTNPRSIANLRPWKKGESPNRNGNPFIGYANAFRSDLWTASTPERRKALAELLWAYALGKATVPVEKDGLPVVDPDGTPRVKTLPPQPWAMEMLMQRLMGNLNFQSIEANVNHTGEAGVQDRAARAVFILTNAGLGDQIPSGLKQMAAEVVAEQQAPPDKPS